MYFFTLAIVSAVLFGAATPASKALLKSLNSFQLAGLLYLGAALAMIPFTFRKNRSFKSNQRQGKSLSYLLGAILFGGIGGPVLLMLGLSKASSASVSLWLNMEMVATAVLGWLIFKDHLGTYGWLGALGILAASGLLGAGEKTAGAGPGLLIAAACVCWGFDNHLTALIDNLTPAQSTLWKGLAAGAVNLGIGMIISSEPISSSSIIPALGVGMFSYGISIMLYISSAQHLGATRSQLVFSAAPFFGMLLAALFLGESISWIQILATAVMIISIMGIFRDRHMHEHQHEALEHHHEHIHDDGHHDHEHEDSTAGESHSHWHAHQPIRHSHPHWPDLHHRHKH